MNLIRPRSNVTKVASELDGKLAGLQREHWDDARDAKVFAGRGVRIVIPAVGLAFPSARGILYPDRPRRPIEEVNGRLVKVISGGAFTASGLYVENFIDILDATQLAIDTSLTSHKWAMYTNTHTPDYGVDTAYTATNEVTGTGYTAGGQTIVSPTTTESPTGTLMYDMGDQVWASPTSVTARGAILYADALAGNNTIVGMTFGADFTSTAGTFTIQFASTGVFTIDLTP